MLTGAEPCESETERLVTLTTIDELWSDYLAAVAELRAGTVWISLGGGNPMGDFLRRLHAMFEELQRTIDEEIAARLESGQTAVGRLARARRDVDVSHDRRAVRNHDRAGHAGPRPDGAEDAAGVD